MRLVVGLTFLLACAFVSLAQVAASISVEPMVAFLDLAPGHAYAGSFQVTNLGDQEARLEILLNDFVLDEEGGLTALEPGTLGERSLAPYLTYSPTNLVLSPGETKMVRYSISLPPDASGPHWATLIITPEAPVEVPTEMGEGELAFVVKYRLMYAFTIVQNPPGSSKPLGQMVGIEVKGETREGKKLLTVRGAFQNLCEEILACKVYFEVRDESGEVILRHDLPRERLVLPNSVRVFSHTFEDVEMPPGQYLILCVVDFGGEYLAAGQYLATVKE